MDRDQSPRDSYWQQDREGRFALYCDEQERAVVDHSQQRMTVHYEDGFTADVTMPDYVCLFSEAERHLGQSRVDDVRGADGSPDPDARKGSEIEADLAREARTPEQWARAYAARTYHLLTLNGVDRELTNAETEAGLRLADAIAIIDRQDPDTFPSVRDHLEVASGLLADGNEDQRYGSPSLACDRALAVIEYENAQLAMREAAAEQALRRDGSLDWLFQSSHAGRDSEIVMDRDAGDASRER